LTFLGYASKLCKPLVSCKSSTGDGDLYRCGSLAVYDATSLETWGYIARVAMKRSSGTGARLGSCGCIAGIVMAERKGLGDGMRACEWAWSAAEGNHRMSARERVDKESLKASLHLSDGGV
jgi:hypothetical protein